MGLLKSGTLTTNTTTTPILVEKGEVWCQASGTFGAGTASFEVSLDNGTFYGVPDSDAALTENGIVKIDLPEGARIRVSLTGATAPVIYWVIRQ